MSKRKITLNGQDVATLGQEKTSDRTQFTAEATSAARHAWLEDATSWARKWLADHGTEVPDAVRVSIGTMYASKVAIGQCWHANASEDGHREVFVSPTVSDATTIVAVLVHELIHAALPEGTKHGPVFKSHAVKAGLEGKMTATTPGEELASAISLFVEGRGPFPGAKLNPAASGIRKQGTRLLKCECATCGYTARTTAKWLNQYGPPICPAEDGDHGPMEGPPSDEGEGE